MNHAMIVLRIALFGAAGVLLGLAHFAGLRFNMRLYLMHDRVRAAVGVHALRLAAVGAAWVVLARYGGAAATVAAFVGMLTARQVVMARARRAS